jgi:3-(3-hydroxy-phenyl)propionate hydroxylase
MAPHESDYEIVHRTIYRVHQRVAKTWRRGRVLLAGDAAHINNPLGGMGMNGGIHDAWNLAEKLMQIHAGEGDDRLLDRYDRQRRGVCVRFVQEQTIKNRQAIKSKDRQAELMRIAADPEQAKSFLLKSSMIASLRDAELID